MVHLRRSLALEGVPRYYWGGYGLYAFPFTSFHVAAHAHPLPYRREVVVALEPFDYARMDEQSRYAGPGTASAGGSAR